MLCGSGHGKGSAVSPSVVETTRMKERWQLEAQETLPDYSYHASRTTRPKTWQPAGIGPADIFEVLARFLQPDIRPLKWSPRRAKCFATGVIITESEVRERLTSAVLHA